MPPVIRHALAIRMLTQAFSHNFDIGILVAGDQDYVGLVEEVKHAGLNVRGVFFDNKALDPNLKLAFDKFEPLNLNTPELLKGIEHILATLKR